MDTDTKVKREVIAHKNKEFFESLAKEIPKFSDALFYTNKLLARGYPDLDVREYLGSMKNPTLYIVKIILKMVLSVALACLVFIGLFIYNYVSYSYPTEFVEKISFQKGNTGLSALFFLQDDEMVRSVACSPDNKNIQTYPKENLEVLLQACDIQKKSIQTNHIPIQNFEYLVDMSLELPDSPKNSQIEYLEMRISLVDVYGTVKTHFSTGTHITRGNEVMRTLKQLFSQNLDSVYFSSKVPIIDNRKRDLLSLKLEVLEKDLAPTDSSLLLSPQLFGYSYYMTYYFWVVGYAVSLLAFWLTMGFSGCCLFIFGGFKPDRKKAE